MTTPNRPPFPDWYQKGRRVPPHIGPTQRELIARRIRSLRKFLIGASFIGVASFTTLAAYHTESKTSTAAAETTATTAVVQESAATTQVTIPAQSLFNEEETKGFTAEAEHSDDGEGVAAAPAPATHTAGRDIASNSARRHDGARAAVNDCPGYGAPDLLAASHEDRVVVRVV